MKKIILIVFCLPVIFGACRKTYQCKCTNSQATYDAGEVEAKSKSSARKSCEKLSGGSTTCTLK